MHPPGLNIGHGGNELEMIDQLMERMRIHENNMINIQHELGEPINYRHGVGAGLDRQRGADAGEGFGAAMAGMNNQIIAENGPMPRYAELANGGQEIL